MADPPSSRACWVPGAAGSLFDADNLPYGVFVPAGPDDAARVGARIGDHVLDLAQAADATGQGFADLMGSPSLNAFMAAGRRTWSAVRAWLNDVLTVTDADQIEQLAPVLHPLDEVRLLLPFEVADFVDYYASEHHATNVGRIFRPEAEPLLSNWKHLPVAYHGRAGSVVVSGTAIHRPTGQRATRGRGGPDFGPSLRLDVEAELGFVVGRAVPPGRRVATAELSDTVFGVTGLNDWSARDVQAWESRPLGPNLGKSFATSISAWVTPLEALRPARIPLPRQQPTVLPYLREAEPTGYDLDVEIEVNGDVVATPPYASMYWSPAQMLAQLASNGAPLRVGDLFGSGTISGPERHQRGSFLELSWGGQESWTAAGQPRTFLEDGDEVVLRYTAPGERGRIALGEVRGAVLPAEW